RVPVLDRLRAVLRRPVEPRAAQFERVQHVPAHEGAIRLAGRGNGDRPGKAIAEIGILEIAIPLWPRRAQRVAEQPRGRPPRIAAQEQVPHQARPRRIDGQARTVREQIQQGHVLERAGPHVGHRGQPLAHGHVPAQHARLDQARDHQAGHGLADRAIMPHIVDRRGRAAGLAEAAHRRDGLFVRAENGACRRGQIEGVAEPPQPRRYRMRGCPDRLGWRWHGSFPDREGDRRGDRAASRRPSD
ncbi:conserved hypothetical protein, partial [Ricinus communis]